MIVTVMYGVVREGMTSRSGIIRTFYVLECADEIHFGQPAAPKRARAKAGLRRSRRGGLRAVAAVPRLPAPPRWPGRRGTDRRRNGAPTQATSATSTTRRSRKSTPRNFNALEIAWRFKTDQLGPRPEFKLEGTPLMVNGVLYTTAGTRRSVVALDAVTGELRWMHAEHEGARAAASPRQLSGRGVAYWSRRPRRAHSLHHHRLPPRRARRAHRRPHPVVRPRRHRRSEGGRRLREASSQIDLRHRRDRRALDAGDHQGRRGDDRIVVPRRRHAEDAQQHEGQRPRLRRAHRQAAVDVQHDSASGRVRQRDVGEGIVGGERQHRRLEPDRRRRRARPRVSARRDAELGFLRRPAARQQPLRREHRRDRLPHRRAQVALSARAPSNLEHGHRRGADPRRSDR